MATSMPQPGGGADQSSSQDQQANPLQQTLGKMVLMVRQLGQQNTIIDDDMKQASAILVQALQKVSQAAPGPAQAPQQQ